MARERERERETERESQRERERREREETHTHTHTYAPHQRLSAIVGRVWSHVIQSFPGLGRISTRGPHPQALF